MKPPRISAGLYFQASTITAPSGAVVLRYRRRNSVYAMTPHDVWSRYLDIYGQEGVFPVADTEIGRLAAVASDEILDPEIARALALRGAEVFARCSSQIGSLNPTHKHIARRARAFENLACASTTILRRPGRWSGAMRLSGHRP